MDIRNTLIFIRESKGYSKRTVSEMTGIPYTTYIKYESGERKDVSMDALVKIADFYGVTTDYLLGRPDAKPPADPVEEFVDKVNMQEQEQIILKKWLALDEKQRRAVYDFMADIVHEYERCASISENQNVNRR
ncbi:MAG: helix-turn-helix domain-containing protein [Ruminococcus flavefaciens]|nr:helix-turn-helix domain-containing protein [Ruminococcus flavefaciens]